jgi:hypothetical protein
MRNHDSALIRTRLGVKKVESYVARELVATWQFMPVSVVTQFMLIPIQNRHQAVVQQLLQTAVAIVLDSDIDYWAYGITMLEHCCSSYVGKNLDVQAVVSKVFKQEKEEDALDAIHSLRRAFREIWDEDMAYETFLHKDNNRVKSLLRLCLRKASKWRDACHMNTLFE